MAKDKSSKKDKGGKPDKGSKSKAPKTDSKSEKVKAKGKDKGASTVGDDDLDDPGMGDSWKIASAVGDLLLVEPISMEKPMKTAHGEAEPLKANVTVLNEKKPGKSEEHHGVLIFQGVLIGSLRDKIGRKVVGRLVMGEAKGSNSAPYVLEPADKDEKDVARAYLASR